jgi:hypothetical protein
MRPDAVVVISELGRSSARLEDRGERMHVDEVVADLSKFSDPFAFCVGLLGSMKCS